MAKKKATEQEQGHEPETGLATQQNQPPATFADGQRPGLLEGADTEDFAIPVLHLFQDIGNESDQYGEHERGAWVDSMTQEAIESPEVVPVHGKKEVIVWYDRNSQQGSGIYERFDSRAEVPQELAESPDFNVVDTISWFVILGHEPIPYVLRFKSTSLKSARQLNTMESARAAQNKPLGKYKLGVRQRSNDQGKWYAPTITPAGDADDAQTELAKAAHRMIASGQAKAHEVEEQDDGIPV